MYKHTFYLFLIVTTLFTACREDEPDPVSETRLGDVIVVNEGNFTEGDGSLSLYDPGKGSVTQLVFDKANGQKIGAILQSMTVYQNKAFVITNVTDKIEVINAGTFERLTSPVEDSTLITPRYMAVAGNKAYVTAWGPYEEDFSLSQSQVFVVSLSDYSILKKIDTDDGAEDVVVTGDKVFVANSFTNTLTVINTKTDAVDTVLTINFGPTHMEVDRNDMLWVSTTGTLKGTPKFLQIDPASYAVKAAVDVARSAPNGKFTMNAERDSLFYLGSVAGTSGESAVYSLAVESPVAPSSPLITGNSFYGIGIDPASNILYVAEANDFQGAGTVLRYQTNGTLLDDFPVGVAPNEFVFR